jgi:UDP-N-acetylglucosamine transferase subunit ALG13
LIFLTVGTQLGFDRLVRGVDAWLALWSERSAHERPTVFGQIADPGPKGYFPENFRWTKFLDPESFNDMFARADYIVAHAGIGSIIGALSAGKPILIMPRRAHLGEQRNDHQYATVQRFGTKQGVMVAMEELDVPPALDALTATRTTSSATRISEFADLQLVATIRAHVRKA